MTVSDWLTGCLSLHGSEYQFQLFISDKKLRKCVVKKKLIHRLTKMSPNFRSTHKGTLTPHNHTCTQHISRHM